MAECVGANKNKPNSVQHKNIHSSYTFRASSSDAFDAIPEHPLPILALLHLPELGLHLEEGLDGLVGLGFDLGGLEGLGELQR